MSELTDALIQLLGVKTGLVVVVLLVADGLQTRYLAHIISRVDEDVADTRERVRRVESYHMETDGGEGDQ